MFTLYRYNWDNESFIICYLYVYFVQISQFWFINVHVSYLCSVRLVRNFQCT